MTQQTKPMHWADRLHAIFTRDRTPTTRKHTWVRADGADAGRAMLADLPEGAILTVAFHGWAGERVTRRIGGVIYLRPNDGKALPFWQALDLDKDDIVAFEFTTEEPR